MPAVPLDEAALVAALRSGDEQAFATLIDTLSSALLRLARMYVPTGAIAEEVVQETWLGVLNGIDRFEGRSSLKTWVFRILVNTAKTRGTQERRTIPFSSAVDPGAEDAGPVVQPERFLDAGHRYAGHWSLGPTAWELPEEALATGETRAVILQAIADLPDAQREVITLRDIEGWGSSEVCGALEVSAGNQRVLLHRARAKVRNAIEAHLGAFEPTL